MADPIQWADGSVEEWDDQNKLRISKPSFQNVKDNLTSGAITLNKIRNLIPKPPEQLVEGVDWSYKNSPLGIADQGAQLLGDDVSRFLTDKGAPKWVGGAAALGIGLAVPGPGGKVQGIKGLDKARKVAIKANKANKGFNFFSPNQTLQPNYATVGPGNLQINPQGTNIKPNNPLMIKGTSLNKPPVKTAELGPFPKNRDAGGPLIKKQQDLLKTKDQLKLERKDFTKAHNIATQGPLKHHHKFDQYIGARVSNRTDSPRLLQMLEAEEGIVIGDKAQNIIGLADQKTYLRRTSAMEDVAKQLGWKDLPPNRTPERRFLDDLFKEPTKKKPLPLPGDPQSWGLPRGKSTGTNTWEIAFDPNLSKKERRAIIQKAYDNRFVHNKIDKSKIKYDRGGTIVSGDHIDLTHYTGIESKDFTQRTELINLLESGKHLKLSTRQLKDKVTEVYRIQENIAVNVAVRRMNFIKDYVTNSGKIPPATRDMLLRDPNKLREWIVNNPGISGNIGWKLKNPGFKELSKTPNSRHLKEWRDGQSPLQIIFGKGASISRPKGWEAPAQPADLLKLQQHFK